MIFFFILIAIVKLIPEVLILLTQKIGIHNIRIGIDVLKYRTKLNN